MDFNELIALLREPGENEIPGTIYDDLTAAHTGAIEGASAKLAEVESALADSVAEVARLKALNFDLLMAASGTPDDAENDPTPDEPDTGSSFDSIFERV